MDATHPKIDESSVKKFFIDRAKKIGEITETQAVLYQDKMVGLADSRDMAEKNLLLPKLNLESGDRFFDIGCGTGRWAKIVTPRVHYYHGTDLTEDFINYARDNLSSTNVKFSCIPCTEITLDAINEAVKF